MENTGLFRSFIIESHEKHPELFPPGFTGQFVFKGFIRSKKQNGFRTRRIRLKNTEGAVYQIRPSFMMPYMTAMTENVEKALYLRRWGVPFDALAYVFGRDAMFWYRTYVSLGRNSVTGTAVRHPGNLPKHLIGDEKHTRQQGEKVYIATTVAQNCILGADITPDAGTESLTEGYRAFMEESLDVDSDYRPETVNTDGWNPTRQAWRNLFPAVTVILCFFHAFLKIRDRCRRSPELLREIGDKVWNIWHSETVAQFSQRIRRLREWADNHLKEDPVKDKVIRLCKKAPEFKVALYKPDAYRTSNMLDRLMNYQDRILYAMQYFHGTQASARLYVRSMAIVWNFHPYGTKTGRQHPGRCSPFKDINGFCYHDNWLQNLLVAASIGGYRT